MSRPAGYQRWRDLLFLHWPIPADALRRAVPAAHEIDLHEGTAYVGLVAFAMEGVRPAWLPEALSFRFLETNARTYVRGAGGSDPGVYFFSLDAASRLAVWAARIGWGLPYHFARMRLDRRGAEIAYETRRARGGAALAVRYEPGEALGPSRPGTLEHFLVERYLLHVERRGRLSVGEVRHPPYPLRAARVLECRESLIAAAGLPAPAGPPPLAHYSPGVDVEVGDLREPCIMR